MVGRMRDNDAARVGAPPAAAPDLGLYTVLREDGSADPATDPHLPADVVRRAYREMKRLRLLDARMILLQRQGRVGFYGACTGQEATPIGAALAIEPGDWIFPALRESVMMLVRGFPLATYVAQVYGNEGDLLKGRQMPSHMRGRRVQQVSWSSCIPARRSPRPSAPRGPRSSGAIPRSCSGSWATAPRASPTSTPG